MVTIITIVLIAVQNQYLIHHYLIKLKFEFKKKIKKYVYNIQNKCIFKFKSQIWPTCNLNLLFLNLLTQLFM